MPLPTAVEKSVYDQVDHDLSLFCRKRDNSVGQATNSSLQSSSSSTSSSSSSSATFKSRNTQAKGAPKWLKTGRYGKIYCFGLHELIID